MPMTRREIDALLKLPNIAVMAVMAPDGAPHAVPVWYEWKRGAATMFMDPGSFKVRCLKNDPRMTLVIDTKKPPYKSVILKGKAAIEIKQADPWLRRMSVAYYGPREGLKFADSLKGIKFAFVTLKPDRIISFDAARDG